MFKDLKNKVRRMKRKILRLEEKADIAKKELSMQFAECSPITKMLKKVFVHNKENKIKFTKEIVLSTIRVLTDHAETADSTEINEFAESMTEQVMNLGNRIMGKTGGNRYSPNLIRLSLSIWMRSKTAYDHMQQSNMFMFPSVRLLALRKKENKINQGFSPKLYSRMYDEVVSLSGNKIVGHVMVDKM